MNRWTGILLLGMAVFLGCWSVLGLAETPTPYELYLRASRYEVANDMPRALYWYKRSADAGDVDAQLRLGKLYRGGFNVETDYVQSAHYYEMAADQGNPIAEYKVGTMYYGGQGVDQSNATAEKWFRLSAAQGLPQAFHALDVMRTNGHCCTTPLNVAALPASPAAAPVQ